MIKVLHWCALRISGAAESLSDFAVWLHEKGGNLELWCDSRAQRRKWVRWGKEHNLTVTWFDVPKLDPSDFKGEYVPFGPRPWPITMLDEWEPKAPLSVQNILNPLLDKEGE
jgi:hypothetical protein